MDSFWDRFVDDDGNRIATQKQMKSNRKIEPHKMIMMMMVDNKTMFIGWCIFRIDYFQKLGKYPVFFLFALPLFPERGGSSFIEKSWFSCCNLRFFLGGLFSKSKFGRTRKT